ncbi:MAG: hypothetical protein ACI30R_04455 [Sodaliphilus sp.]
MALRRVEYVEYLALRRVEYVEYLALRRVEYVEYLALRRVEYVEYPGLRRVEYVEYLALRRVEYVEYPGLRRVAICWDVWDGWWVANESSHCNPFAMVRSVLIEMPDGVQKKYYLAVGSEVVCEGIIFWN